MSDSFDIFWQAYPRKVGKKLAQQKYAKAVRKHGAATIMAGLERYKRTKPDYADWLHASTFLNQERFKDGPDTDGRRNGNNSESDRLVAASSSQRFQKWPITAAFDAIESLRKGQPLDSREREALKQWDGPVLRGRAARLGLTLP